ASGIDGQVQMKRPGPQIDGNRDGKRQGRNPPEQPQDRRKPEQQDNVERQHVHVGGLELEQQRLNDRLVGVLEKIEDVHFLGIERVLKARRDVGNLGHVDGEQENVR